MIKKQTALMSQMSLEIHEIVLYQLLTDKYIFKTIFNTPEIKLRQVDVVDEIISSTEGALLQAVKFHNRISRTAYTRIQIQN